MDFGEKMPKASPMQLENTGREKHGAESFVALGS
jgi:hypothetical protein